MGSNVLLSSVTFRLSIKKYDEEMNMVIIARISGKLLLMIVQCGGSGTGSLLITSTELLEADTDIRINLGTSDRSSTYEMSSHSANPVLPSPQRRCLVRNIGHHDTYLSEILSWQALSRYRHSWWQHCLRLVDSSVWHLRLMSSLISSECRQQKL